MATQNVNIGINISDNGTAKKVIKDVNSLHSTIKATQASAEKLSAPKAAGFRGAAAPTGSEAQLSNQEYNRGRGSMGATGASARDFANQAQGLGGLVRLYATYAANVFAVGAAFRALSGAMDTANLVRGLDQLGAASGTALGTLSKRLVEATDGAISLREAMEATAKASSSGMSSENILRMGKVAKQAAQALGVDMADAVNRLTRGITKLEPELLDEIGIFTKVDMATQAYAKSMGKSTAAVTDFEKRMAFANAVLEEGERKFSAIDFDTNPYTKLLATLKDVSQIGLELVNKVLGPLVKFLSENPVALAAAMGAIGVSLVKQALPAIGQMREGLRANAQEALETADAFKSSFGDEFQGLLEKRFRIPDLEAGVRKAQQDLNSLKVPTNIAQSVKNLASDTASTADIKNAQKALETRNKLIETGMRGTKAASAAQIQAAKEEIAYIKQSIALYERKQAVSRARAGTEEVANIEQGPLDPQILALKRYEKLRAEVDKSTAISNAAQNAQIAGIRGSWALLNQEISEKGITGFNRYSTLVQGGLAAIGTRVMGVLNAFSWIGMVIGAATAAFTAINAVLSNNAKQLSEVSTAAEATTESLANLGRTIDAINEKPFGEQFGTKSLLASATAINEISISINGLINKTLAADKAANSFDRFVDGFKTLWGGDLRSQFAETISGTVFGAFENLEDSPRARTARANIASLLNISPDSSMKEWESAFAAIADNEPVLKSVQKELTALSMATGQAADDAQQFDLAMTKSKDALKAFTDQFKVRDELSLFGAELIETSKTTAAALKDPQTAIARLATVVSDTSLLALFDDTDRNNLIEYGSSIKSLNSDFEEQKSKVNASKQAIKELETQLESLRAQNSDGSFATDEEMAGNKAFEQAKRALDARRTQLQNQQKLLANTEKDIVALTARFPSVAANQFAKGAAIVEKGILASFAKANTAFADAVLSALGDLPGVARQRAAMEDRRLKSEAALIKTNLELIKASMINTIALRKASAEQKLIQANEVQRESRGAPAAVQAVQEAIKELNDIVEVERIININPSKAVNAVGAVTKAYKNGNKIAQEMSSSLISYLQTVSGTALQLVNNQDAQAANNFKAAVDSRAEELSQVKQIIDLDKQQTNQRAEAINSLKGINGELSLQQQLELEAETSRLRGLDALQQVLEVQTEMDKLTAARGSKILSPELEQSYKDEMLLLEAKKQAINDSAQAEVDALARVQAARQEQANYDALIGSIKTLEGVFEGLGSSISSTVSAFREMSTASTKYEREIGRLESKRQDLIDQGQDTKKLDKQISDTRIAYTKTEVSNYGRVAGAAKGLFKEKSTAYKVLAATEKAMHLARLGMDIAEMISDATKTTQEVANAGVRTGAAVAEAGVSGTAAILNQGKGDPYTAIPRMAAMAAIVAVLLNEIGGKAGKVQNTGGAMENDGTGTTFGDASAQSESISKSLEIVTDADPVLMRNSANMLKHLRSIDNNIAQLGVNFIKSLGGESISGSMGVQPGFRNTTEGNYLLFGLPGLALRSIPVIGEFLGGLLDKTAKALGFGTKVTVLGEGLQLGGQRFEDITSRGVNAKFYADVKTEKKALGITYDSDTTRNFMSIDENLRINIQRIFEGFGSAVLTAGKILGFNLDTITSSLNKYTVSLQNIKLTGTLEEQTAKLEAAFGKIGDQMFKSILPGLEDFIKAGEGYMTTAVRVSYAVDEAASVLERLGIEAINFSQVIDKQGDIAAEIVRQSIMMRESNEFISTVIDTINGSAQDIAEVYTALDTMRTAVIDFGGSAQFLSQEAFRAAGGLDNLSDSVSSFYDAFTSETEKLAVNNRKVSEVFLELGIAVPQSREALLSLVNSLTGIDAAAAARLMASTDILDAYYTAIEDSNEELLEKQTAVANERSSLEEKLLQLLGRTNELRARELARLDESNRNFQLVIWSIEDLNKSLSDAKNTVEKAAQAIKSAEGSIDSIRNKATDNYVNATQKVAAAQQSIADLAVEAAKKMRDFGKSLREFISSQVLGQNTGQNAGLAFARNVEAALTGDTAAIEDVAQLAQAAIDAARASSRSAQEFASLRSGVLAGVTKVAEFAESRAVGIPEEEDPLVRANRSLEDAVREQTQALLIATNIGASLVKTPEDLIAQYLKANEDLAAAVLEQTSGLDAQQKAQAALDAIAAATKSTATGISTVAESTDLLTYATALGADQTAESIQSLNNQNLLAIANNTATNILGTQNLLEFSLKQNSSLERLVSSIDAVVTNTKALADAVKAGSGTASSAAAAPSGTSSNPLTQALGLITGTVSGVANAVGKAVETIVTAPIKLLGKLFSDERTKTNVTLASTLSNGISLYDYNYKAPYSSLYGSDRKRGVIAQEVMGQYPAAVSMGKNGMYMVDYSKLPIPTDMLKFATGGVFSNSVITRPTGFELGLMGEAGPEAVMPLSRTRNGQLGVVAQTAPGDSSAREMLKQNAALITEVKNLREEVSLLRHEARATASATTKTTRLLERVTQNGDSLLVTDTATV